MSTYLFTICKAKRARVARNASSQDIKCIVLNYDYFFHIICEQSELNVSMMLDT